MGFENLGCKDLGLQVWWFVIFTFTVECSVEKRRKGSVILILIFGVFEFGVLRGLKFAIQGLEVYV